MNIEDLREKIYKEQFWGHKDGIECDKANEVLKILVKILFY
jgi:hypothetical protein